MEIYCMKCKRKTTSQDSGEYVKTVNNKWRLNTTCNICGQRKGAFVKVPKPSMAAKEVHRPVIKHFPRRRIVTLGIDDLWAADLVVMRKYASENDGYNYMLNVIDTFSKFAWSEPLMTKRGAEVAESFMLILKRAIDVNGHTAPRLLHTDKGKEFLNRDFKSVLQSYNIKMYHTENEEKSAIIERFNRTLNEKMKVIFETRNYFRWLDIVQDLLHQYNNSVHRTICMKPAEVTKADVPRLLERFSNIPHTPRKIKFQLGDRVRIVAKKDTFADKYSRNWTREIFTISKVQDTFPITYRIKDKSGEEIIGSFYEKELQKTLCTPGQ